MAQLPPRLRPLTLPLVVALASRAAAEPRACDGPPIPASRDYAAEGIRVRAESHEVTGAGHVAARGLVDARLSDMRVQADKADVFEKVLADGRPEIAGQLPHAVQRCAVTVRGAGSSLAGVARKPRFTVEPELANVGSVGRSFGGGDRRRLGLGGYR